MRPVPLEREHRCRKCRRHLQFISNNSATIGAGQEAVSISYKQAYRFTSLLVCTCPGIAVDRIPVVGNMIPGQCVQTDLTSLPRHPIYPSHLPLAFPDLRNNPVAELLTLLSFGVIA